MTTAQRLTPADRNRATRRLRSITVGVTLVGATATLGFSAVAALSNPGTTVATTTGSTSSTNSTSSSGSVSSSTSDDSSATTPLQSNSGVGSSSGGGSNAVSGGS
jgi:hypothetical protein